VKRNLHLVKPAVVARPRNPFKKEEEAMTREELARMEQELAGHKARLEKVERATALKHVINGLRIEYAKASDDTRRKDLEAQIEAKQKELTEIGLSAVEAERQAEQKKAASNFINSVPAPNVTQIEKPGYVKRVFTGVCDGVKTMVTAVF